LDQVSVFFVYFQEFTDNFLKPFKEVALLEVSVDENGERFSPWVKTGKSLSKNENR
jgi:hypothetical protein